MVISNLYYAVVICKGLAQDLVGCEVAAEIDNLNVVYEIVTNYVQWNFLRSLDEKN